MLNRVFKRSLRVRVDGRDLEFRTPAEFEFALAGRVGVAPEKFAELSALSRAELRREAQNIKTTEQEFVSIMTRSLAQPGSVGALLRQLDLKIFSQDHGWRDIIRALNEAGPEADAYRQIALVKYMQYLTARQDIIKQAYHLRQAERERLRDTALVEAAMAGDASLEHDIPADSGLRETVIFDSATFDAFDPTEQTFTRLPKGEAVTIALAEDGAIDLLLSKHQFRFVNRHQGELQDDLGNVYRLGSGKNIVGRDAVCNIVVDGTYRDVSRLHLVIEAVSPRAFVFTDLSSHGTFVPSTAVSPRPA